jgi:hypothetical protein
LECGGADTALDLGRADGRYNVGWHAFAAPSPHETTINQHGESMGRGRDIVHSTHRTMLLPS